MNETLVKRVFFDHTSTTPTDPRVVEAMLPYFTERYGNPSSHIHEAGVIAGRAVDRAREQVAKLIAAKPEEVIFTSGGTESNNLAVRGVLQATASAGGHLIVAATEHYSILNLARRLEKEGRKLTVLPVDPLGHVSPIALERALRPDTRLVAIAHASSEIGTIEHLAALTALTRPRGIHFHADAVASVGNIPVSVGELGVDSLSLSAHNFYGPKGIGALWLRDGVRMHNILEGGWQERSLRPGTENVPGIVGMGAAAELALAEMPDRIPRLRKLGLAISTALAERFTIVHFTGDPEARLPGHISFWVEYVEGESLLMWLNIQGFMASSGSACSSNLKGEDEEDLHGSHVLLSVGVPAEFCTGSLTLSLGRENTQEEVDRFLSVFPGIVERLLAMSPLWADAQLGKVTHMPSKANAE